MTQVSTKFTTILKLFRFTFQRFTFNSSTHSHQKVTPHQCQPPVALVDDKVLFNSLVANDFVGKLNFLKLQQFANYNYFYLSHHFETRSLHQGSRFSFLLTAGLSVFLHFGHVHRPRVFRMFLLLSLTFFFNFLNKSRL